MKPYVVERYTPAIVSQVAQRYGLKTEQLRDLGGFESFVYETELGGRPAIIKVGHSDRRTAELLKGEAEFTRYLAENGVSVSSTIPSPVGNLIEAIDDLNGGHFYAGAWTRADGNGPGRLCDDPDFWTAHGRLLGRIHALSSGFEPSEPRFARPHWDDPIHLNDSMYIPDSDVGANIEMRRLLGEMRSFPRTTDVYGLVHLDAHGGNVHFDGTTVTLFDFDDCGFTWFADDLAIVMYYALLPFDDPVEAAGRIWPAFIAAYQDEHHIDAAWFEKFPTFLSWRDHLLYSIIHRSNMEEDELDVAAWTDRFHARHEGGTPIVDFDFTTGVEM
jgi:Ser/Thr protein kinase RdoA (MazF antagonist)